jgi:anti-anti-sigma factor
MATPAPTISLTVEIERKGDTAIFHCRGRLVSGVTAFLHKKVYPLIAESKCIVLDLTNLEWVDSTGLGTLVRLYMSCKKAGCEFRLINLGPRVRELLGLTNLLGIFAELGEKGCTHF